MSSPAEGQGDRITRESNSLRAKGLLSLYATAVQGSVRLLYSILVGRLGSRDFLGHTNSSLSIAVLASQLWAAPAAAGGTKYVALKAALEDQDGAQAVAWHLTRRTALIGLVLPTGAALVAATWLDLGTVQAVATCVLTWAYSMYNTLRGVQFGAQNYRRVAVLDTVAAFTALTALAVVLLLGLDAAILLPLTGGYLLFAALAWPHHARRHRLEAPLRREIDRFVLLGVLSGMASGGLLQASQLAAHHFGGASQAGVYAAAFSLATPPSMIAIALTSVIVPPLVGAASRGDRAAVRVQSDRLARELSAAFVLLFGFLVILSPSIMFVVYGSSYASSAGLLLILLVAVMFTSAAVGPAATLTSTRGRGQLAVAGLNLAGLVTSLASWPWLAGRWGTTGVAYGYLAGAVVASAGSLGLTWWVERHVWWDLVLRFGLGLAAMLTLARLTSGVGGLSGILVQAGAALAYVAVGALVNRTDLASLAHSLRGAGVGAS